jgi:HEAT repeat protein
MVPDDEIDPWIALLAMEDYPVAIDRLLTIGEPALRRLIRCVEGSAPIRPDSPVDGRDWYDRLSQALCRLGEAHLEAFLGAFRGREGEAPFFLIWTLAQLDDGGDPRAVDLLIDVLGRGPVPSRWAAAEGLLKRRDRRAIEPLIRALRDRSPMVRGPAVEAMLKFGDERAIEPLRRFLSMRSNAQSPGQLATAERALARLEARAGARRRKP